MAKVSYLANAHELSEERKAELRAKPRLIVPAADPFIQEGAKSNSLKGMTQEVRDWMANELPNNVAFCFVVLNDGKPPHDMDFGFQIFFETEADAVHFKLRWVG